MEVRGLFIGSEQTQPVTFGLGETARGLSAQQMSPGEGTLGYGTKSMQEEFQSTANLFAARERTDG